MKGFVKALAWTVGIVAAVPTAIVILTYFFLHPTGKTPVNVTVLDLAGRPVPNATLTLLQSGERMFIPVPFTPTKRVAKTQQEFTDANGWCRFYVRDQNCNLTKLEVSGQPRRVVHYVHHTGEQGNNPKGSIGWRLAAPPWEYSTTIVVE